MVVGPCVPMACFFVFGIKKWVDRRRDRDRQERRGQGHGGSFFYSPFLLLCPCMLPSNFPIPQPHSMPAMPAAFLPARPPTINACLSPAFFSTHTHHTPYTRTHPPHTPPCLPFSRIPTASYVYMPVPFSFHFLPALPYCSCLWHAFLQRFFLLGSHLHLGFC